MHSWFLKLLLTSSPCDAAEVYFRRFGPSEGLPISHVQSLAIDPRGYLWIGVSGGLARFDGANVTPWATEQVRRPVRDLAIRPDGTIYALERTGQVWEVRDEDARLLDGPRGAFAAVDDLAVDELGRLWVAACGQGGACALYRMEQNGTWSANLNDRLDGRVRGIRAQTDGTLLLITLGGVWRWNSDDTATLVLATEPREPPTRYVDAAIDSEGVIWALEWAGRLMRRADDGEPRIVYERPNRGDSLLLRAGTVWASYNDELIAVRPDGTILHLGRAQGITTGGDMLVDGAGSLWMGGFIGLFQAPEPDTVAWTQDDGLPSDHTRFTAWAQGSAWVSTWAGLGRVRGGKAETLSSRVNQIPCIDKLGRLWIGEWPGKDRAPLVYRFGATKVDQTPFAPGVDWMQCVADDAGLLWIITRTGLWRMSVETMAYTKAKDPPDLVEPSRMAIGPDGSLWLAGGEQVCHTQGPPDVDAPTWLCEAVPGVDKPGALIVLPNGRPWIASQVSGVIERRDGEWRTIPASQALAIRSTNHFSLSPRGGVWVATSGSTLRVLPNDGPEGWTVLEVIAPSHGIAVSEVNSVIEDPEGTLWLSTNAGLISVPSHVRAMKRAPPVFESVSVRSGDRLFEPHQPIEIQASSPVLDVDLKTVSLQGPALVHYRHRLLPASAWTALAGPEVHLEGLPSGDHVLEIQVSADGETWSSEDGTVRVPFTVLRPWYARGWVVLSLAVGPAVLVGAAAILFRRVERTQERRIEQERKQILQNVHDEVGSLVAAAQMQVDRLESDSKDQVRSDTAADLRLTLGDLMLSVRALYWILGRGRRPMSQEDPISLRERFEELLRRYFPDGSWTADTPGPPRLRVLVPRSLPRPLSPPERETILKVAREAVLNVRKHARARSVSIELRTEPDWTLMVADDGVGMDTERVGEMGVGLESMRERARKIGGVLRVVSSPGHGTAVMLSLPVQGVRK